MAWLHGAPDATGSSEGPPKDSAGSPPSPATPATTHRSETRIAGDHYGNSGGTHHGDQTFDFGGSGIKGAPVDLADGELAADRVRIPTPQPATPEAVAEVVRELLGRFPVSV